MRTMITLGEIAERTNKLEVVCRKCGRSGVLSVPRLVQEHGARFPVTELRWVLAGDCERFEAGKAHLVRFPEGEKPTLARAWCRRRRASFPGSPRWH
jgi:hypothetical protein